jgi:hypothetical protein
MHITAGARSENTLISGNAGRKVGTWTNKTERAWVEKWKLAGARSEKSSILRIKWRGANNTAHLASFNNKFATRPSCFTIKSRLFAPHPSHFNLLILDFSLDGVVGRKPEWHKSATIHICIHIFFQNAGNVFDLRLTMWCIFYNKGTIQNQITMFKDIFDNFHTQMVVI